jgi:3-carboxy-cis,cis-muconate cycloisomerase
LARAGRAAAALARRHAATPILARTLMQPAGVTSFGLKAAYWAQALARGRDRVLESASTGLAVALGGAIGNLAAYGGHGERLRAELAASLALHDPGAGWHTHRERWLALAADTALAAGSMHKIAHDIALMAQAEVGEVCEPPAPGRGGSTAMPHKRNPVLSPDVFIGSLSAASALAELLEGLQVDAVRCRRNIDAQHGVVFASELTELLAGALGKPQAQEAVAQLARRALEEAVHLRDLAGALLRDDPRLAARSAEAIDRIFDVDRAAQASARLVEPMLASVTG